METYQKNRNRTGGEPVIPSAMGLSAEEASKRLQAYGNNRLIQTVKIRPGILFFAQFKNLLVLILVGAAILSLVLGSFRDAAILLIILICNALIGFYQEWKSENILASLKSLVLQKCLVLRGGRKLEVPSENLVPGDLVFLSEGDGVPADIRLVDSTGFQANEFILTGESQPAEKSHLPVADRDNASPAGQTDRVFMGTTVAKGEAKGIVLATGMQTRLGKIAGAAAHIDVSKTPLQKELDGVARKITWITLVMAAVLFLGRLLFGETVSGALLFAIGVAAAMVPEGLPAQISVSLALGIARLARKNAVIKKISAVEALGAATVIATDKTGTITKNEITIIHAHFNGKDFTISGTGFEPGGEIFDVDGKRVFKENLREEKVYFLSGFLSSTGRVNPPDTYHQSWYSIGDPTEAAFGTLLLKAGYDLEETEAAYPRLRLFPFDSFRKRITVVRQHKERCIAFVKGSMESLLEISARIRTQGQEREFYPEEKERLLAQAKVLAAQAKRIIALGYKDLEAKEDYRLEEVETGIVFSGFVTMIDPPREEIKQAVDTAFSAGLKVIMLTGDNEITARAVAAAVGMKEADGSLPEVINDKLLKGLGDESVKTWFSRRCLIFSRVSPLDKLRIVTLLKESGEVVAVTGDGVNDTLSLKKADIGVAMGRGGSQVAQEASGIVLLDNNFSTIIAAVREGRTIYGNLKKVVLANLTGNLAELVCVLAGFFGAFYDYPLLIMPLHILLIDLIGNMLPLVMVSFDAPERNIMTDGPRRQGQMLDRESFLVVLYPGLLKGAVSCLAFYLSWQGHRGDPDRHAVAVTVTMASIIICQFINILSSRTRKSVFTPYLFTNPKLYLGFLSSLAFLVVIGYTPALNRLLYTHGPGAADWICVVLGAAVYLVFLELLKARTVRRGLIRISRGRP